MGAHDFAGSTDARRVREHAGRFDLLLSTVHARLDWISYLQTLRPNGTLCLVGSPPGLLQIPAAPLLTGQRSICGSDIGGRATIGEMLRFAAGTASRPRSRPRPWPRSTPRSSACARTRSATGWCSPAELRLVLQRGDDRPAPVTGPARRTQGPQLAPLDLAGVRARDRRRAVEDHLGALGDGRASRSPGSALAELVVELLDSRGRRRSPRRARGGGSRGRPGCRPARGARVTSFRSMASGLNFSPSRMMISLMRPVMKKTRLPAGRRAKKPSSPVRSQPSRVERPPSPRRRGSSRASGWAAHAELAALALAQRRRRRRRRTVTSVPASGPARWRAARRRRAAAAVLLGRVDRARGSRRSWCTRTAPSPGPAGARVCSSKAARQPPVERRRRDQDAAQASGTLLGVGRASGSSGAAASGPRWSPSTDSRADDLRPGERIEALGEDQVPAGRAALVIRPKPKRVRVVERQHRELRRRRRGGSCCAMLQALASRLPWLRPTPLGLPVVPEV